MMKTYPFEPYFFSLEEMPDEASMLKANSRLRQALDALATERLHHQACQMNCAQALGEIRALKYAIDMDRARPQRRDENY